jgi:hypothetical protein
MMVKVILEREEMTLMVTVATEEPPLFTIKQAPDASVGEYDFDGVIVRDYFYPVANIAIKGGT